MSSQKSRRALSLHHSALSDSEYESYTTSLGELLSDAPSEHANDPRVNNSDWETARLSVREVRGWLRGRYGDVISIKDIDKILSYFHSDHNPLGVLTGGEFFAVLRLIHHARSGKEPIQNLVFTQADPNAANRLVLSPPSTSNPFTRSASSQFSPTSDEFPPPSESGSTGISVRSAPPPVRSTSLLSPTRPTIVPALHDGNTSNPFLSRSRTLSHHPAATASPPLPPRRAKPLLPPPKHSSLANPSVMVPGKPNVHPLMQQSLLVAKASRGAAAIEKNLAAQRFSQVISRSSSAAATPAPLAPVPPNGRVRPPPASSEDSSLSVDGSDSRPLRTSDLCSTPIGKPPIPPKPRTKALSNSISTLRGLTNPTAMDEASVSSYEQVAGASNQKDSPFDSPPPSARARSSTLSHTDNNRSQQEIDLFDPNPPPPPPRRKRPESIQVPTRNSITPSSTAPSSANSLNHAPHQTLHSAPSHTARQLSVSGITKTLNAIQVGAEAAKESMASVSANRGKGFTRLFRSEREDSQRLVSSEEEDDESFDHRSHSFEGGDDDPEAWKIKSPSRSQNQPRPLTYSNNHFRDSFDSDSGRLASMNGDRWRSLG